MLQGKDVVSKLLLLCFCIVNDAYLLSAPWNVSMESVNMRHRLRWSPPRPTCPAPSYTVQFQGEWELRYKNDSWEEAMECQFILATECDLTSDLASDSDYNIRVRAECQGQKSHWTKLNATFNRNKSKTTVESLGVQHLSHTFPGLKQGTTYCLRAQAEMEDIGGGVSSNASQCVSIPNWQKSWQVPAVVSAVLVVTVALGCFLGWAAKHRRAVIRNTCLHKIPLPSVLVHNWPEHHAFTLEQPFEALEIPLVVQAPEPKPDQERPSCK
ncbi:cytokine receptor family member B16 [Engraulis encrasicolus]|uniref:cytokine receptor family member B16 n=1 Tax=Engraulis encrasicolus TaxID=184585 RepID=UPI002FD0FCFD